MEKKEYIINLGWIINRIRKHRGLSREQFAEQVGSTKGTISQIELGNSSASLQMLDKFAEVLGVEKYVFLYLASNIRKNPPTDVLKSQSMWHFNAFFMEHCRIVYGLTNIDF